MLTWEDDVGIHALHRQGWTISAIARHTGRDRKTVRAYLTGKRTPGVRARTEDPFAPFVDYVSARLGEDPHLWAFTLFDELQPLGFNQSYQTLTRDIRTRKLRPDCPACRGATGRANAVIDHPPGEETQWDWLDLPDPPTFWEWGKTAHLVAYRGNRYSVPPELAGGHVTVSQPFGADHLDIATTAGIVVARHRLAVDGTGALVRDHGHVVALNAAALAGASSARPHRRKERIPTRTGRSHRRRHPPRPGHPGRHRHRPSAYERAATGRNTLT
jgi:hypothetical protein